MAHKKGKAKNKQKTAFLRASSIVMASVILASVFSVATIAMSLQYHSYRDNFRKPMVDDDSGWIISRTQYGMPWTIYKETVRNQGFWSGYTKQTDKTVCWEVIAGYFAGFLLISGLIVLGLERHLGQKPPARQRTNDNKRHRKTNR